MQRLQSQDPKRTYPQTPEAARKQQAQGTQLVPLCGCLLFLDNKQAFGSQFLIQILFVTSELLQDKVRQIKNFNRI